MVMGQIGLAPGAVVVRRRRPRNVKGKALNKKQKQQVKKLVSRVQELKVFQHYYNAAVSTTGDIVGIADIAQGAASNNRDGDRIQHAGSIELRLRVQNAVGVTADTYNNIRLIIFQWHPASTPVIPNILSTGPFASYDYLSPYNHNTRQQYRIMFDRTYNTHYGVAPTTFPDTFTIVANYKIPVKRASKFTEFTPSGALTGTNRFFMIVISDSSLPAHPEIALSLKSFFRDS